VHSTFEPPRKGERAPNLIINVDWDDGESDNVYIKVRPETYNFLTQVTKIFEVVIFTASIFNYADPLVSRLDK
jgi:RNA polymerase II subunit A small phosphatase-like protein